MSETRSLAEVIQETIPVEKETFVVDSTAKASWAASKYLEAQERISACKKQAEEYTKKIDQWFSQAIKEDLKTMDFMEYQIWPYAQSIIEVHKSKTLKVPGANISLRKKPDQVDMEDEGLVLGYMEQIHPELVETRKQVKKTDLKTLLENNELIPGAFLRKGEESLHIKRV